ncbi:helix-turn-helix domain-containing protein [Bacillus sp. ISL-40]|uniref:helix-turn-helix domain-containing protein n=1 Tax=unclassified Bacillus (in: firmicutes) TaxID=185979 RepID=UPI001BE50A26|nr:MULTISPECIES: RodZ domain-containing protein [unclassified Bacillus (in: firmicutes)]MBT2700061.1 helix-turn-helix domain-containing protein [Bacillus sp. ISL-40]MBT2720620.1 helix-turn-helix domain-containing protein [Bacillus sp. ISL-46]MBT2741283.1 helix-turn-helix domain-containing protein [Bacillus sp. ISL-77]
MTELGNRLKEARLAKGLSLDDVQSMTKIQKRYLIGIEEGNYASMPGNFYVRAFIKQYAEALSLNPDEIFETYKGEIPATYNDDLPQQLSRVKTHKTITEGNSKIFDILPKVLIGVFVIGAASLVYYFISNHAAGNSNESISKQNEPVKIVTSKNLDKEKADDKDNQKVNEEQKDNTVQEEEQTTVEETPKQEITAVQSSGRNSTYELKNADKFIVKLVSKGQTWVSIKNGKGKSFFQGTLKTGSTESQTEDLSAESMAVIRVGNAADTEIYVNDQKLEYAVPATANVQNITIQYVLKDE